LFFMTLVSWLICFYQPTGESPIDIAERFFSQVGGGLSDYSLDLLHPKKEEGSWVWLLVALLFSLENIPFSFFASWDEFLVFFRRRLEEWSQRPFNMSKPKEDQKKEKTETTTLPTSGLWGYVAKIWDYLDEAIIADIAVDGGKKFGSILLKKLTRY